jgi:flavin-dependent thymidylate synthase
LATPGKEIAQYADVAMYDAAPNIGAQQGGLVEPRVHLVSMTAQPLRVMAAASELYAGRIVTDPFSVSDTTALRWLADMTRTKLQAPLEFIDLHFFFEGVTRAFTHQLVRQRTAVFVQESMRFAVKNNADFETAIPPSIARLKTDDPQRFAWTLAVTQASDTYRRLVNSGIPAEDARGLLPTNITTRIHYKTNLRNLADQAGMRLCSQAQYEWKLVWEQMIHAILNFGPAEERWQQREIARLFKPVCYRTGRCEFRADTDRYCSIRSRVEAHYAAGEPPEAWTDIDPREALRENAARLAPGEEGR